MNRIEARIQKMRQVAAGKAAVGGDTSVEEDALEELTGNQNEMKHVYKEGKGNGSGHGSQGSSGKGNN